MIRQAIEESRKEAEREEQRRQNPFAGINLDEAIMSTMMALSINENMDKSQMSRGVLVAVENGFTTEQAIEAQSLVGDDPDLILAYLFDKVSMM